jgi:hypothetical protein
MRSEFDCGAPDRIAKELRVITLVCRRCPEMVRFKELPKELQERRLRQCLTDFAFMGYLESSHSSTRGGYRVKDGMTKQLVDYYANLLARARRARPRVDWAGHFRLMEELRVVGETT